MNKVPYKEYKELRQEFIKIKYAANFVHFYISNEHKVVLFTHSGAYFSANFEASDELVFKCQRFLELEKRTY